MVVWGSSSGERSEAGSDHLSPEFFATGLSTSVIIVADFGPDVQHYAHDFPHLTVPKFKSCPHCTTPNRLVGHGSYPRSVINHLQVVAIRVKRFLCSQCHKTVSILPSFCLPWRHYQTSTIQTVLDLRFLAHSSWSAIRRHFEPSDVPTSTTCREWVATFTRHSHSYLDHFLQQVSRWHLAPGKIKLTVEELAKQSSVPQQLVAAVPHLVAFLHDNGVNIGTIGTGNIRWLPTLSQWGQALDIGRLV